MKYHPCPKCGAAGTCVLTHPRKRIAWFECERRHFYAVETAKNGLLLEVRLGA